MGGRGANYADKCSAAEVTITSFPHKAALMSLAAFSSFAFLTSIMIAGWSSYGMGDGEIIPFGGKEAYRALGLFPSALFLLGDIHLSARWLVSVACNGLDTPFKYHLPRWFGRCIIDIHC